jgi:peptidoglycan hydrolase-like amidase
MQYHKLKSARKGKDTICGQSGSGVAATGVTSKAVAGLSNHPMGDQVRIAIYGTNGSAISVTSSGSYQVREGGSKILGTLGKDDVVQVSWSDNKYHVRGSGVSFDTGNVIRLVPLNQAVMEIKSYSDLSATIPGKNYNKFRGIIEIRKCDGCGELWAINELRVEYYLRGLAETSGEGPEEYLKALSIAARTYVLYHKAVTGGRSVNKGYDIGKTADDQIYRGYEYEIITPRMASVFNQVKGVIVADSEGDKPVSTVYFSDSDGRTRSAKEAWNTDRFPHLQKSVADPHHVASSCRGHCVGMSAQGAYGFAKKDGWSYQKILKYYYAGVRLVKAY